MNSYDVAICILVILIMVTFLLEAFNYKPYKQIICPVNCGLDHSVWNGNSTAFTCSCCPPAGCSCHNVTQEQCINGNCSIIESKYWCD